MAKTNAKRGLALLITLIALITVMCIGVFADTQPVDVATEEEFWAAVKAAPSNEEQVIYLTASFTATAKSGDTAGDLQNFSGANNRIISIKVHDPATEAYTIKCGYEGGGNIIQIKNSSTVKIYEGVTLDGNNASRLFYLNNGASFYLEGGSLINGSSTSAGCISVAAGGSVYIHSGLIDNCKATTGSGGAITIGSSATAHGVFEMTGGTISNCTAATHSGAIALTGGNVDVTMTGGVITKNTAGTYSGAIYPYANFKEPITNVEISYNTANGKYTSTSGGDQNCAGGVLFLDAGKTITLGKGTVIKGNEATAGRGGAIALRSSGAKIIIDGAEIIENKATSTDQGQAGGIYISNGTVELKSGKISKNYSECSSGGLALGYSSATSKFIMTGGEVSENESKTNSGGINAGYGALEISGGVIKNNKAGTYAGGLNLLNANNVNNTYYIKNCEVIGNTAGSYGAGMVLGMNLTEPMTGVKIYGNLAGTSGGGIWFTPKSGAVNNFILGEGTVLAGNVAGYGKSSGYGGGGFGAERATITIDGAVIGGTELGVKEGDETGVKGNWTCGGAGGLNISSDVTVTLKSGEIKYNNTTSGGGGISVGGTLNIEGGTVANNNCSTNGKGINVSGSGVVTIKGAFTCGDNDIYLGASNQIVKSGDFTWEGKNTVNVAPDSANGKTVIASGAGTVDELDLAKFDTASVVPGNTAELAFNDSAIVLKLTELPKCVTLIHEQTETQYSSIEQAIDAAADGDTIQLDTAEIKFAKLAKVIGKELTITNKEGVDVVISAVNPTATYFFEVGSSKTVTIQEAATGSITFDGADTMTRTCYVNKGATLNVEGCKFTKFAGTSAVFGIAGTLVADGAEIVGNNTRAAQASGDGCSLTFKNCVIANNTSAASGVVLQMPDSRLDATAVFDTCEIYKNTAHTEDNVAYGAIYLTGCNCTIKDCKIGETQADYGGAIYTYKAPTLTFEGTNIIGAFKATDGTEVGANKTPVNTDSVCGELGRDISGCKEATISIDGSLTIGSMCLRGCTVQTNESVTVVPVAEKIDLGLELSAYENGSAVFADDFGTANVEKFKLKTTTYTEKDEETLEETTYKVSLGTDGKLTYTEKQVITPLVKDAEGKWVALDATNGVIEIPADSTSKDLTILFDVVDKDGKEVVGEDIAVINPDYDMMQSGVLLGTPAASTDVNYPNGRMVSMSIFKKTVEFFALNRSDKSSADLEFKYKFASEDDADAQIATLTLKLADAVAAIKVDADGSKDISTVDIDYPVTEQKTVYFDPTLCDQYGLELTGAVVGSFTNTDKVTYDDSGRILTIAEGAPEGEHKLSFTYGTVSKDVTVNIEEIFNGDTPIYDAGNQKFYANGTKITIYKEGDSTKIKWDGGSQTISEEAVVFGGGQADAAYDKSSITMEGGKVKAIYGGGDGNPRSSTVGAAKIVIKGGEVTDNVYGTGAGNATGDVTSATISIEGGKINCLAPTHDSKIGATTITVTGGEVNNLYLGSPFMAMHENSDINGLLTVDVKDDAIVNWLNKGYDQNIEINTTTHPFVKKENLKIVRSCVNNFQISKDRVTLIDALAYTAETPAPTFTALSAKSATKIGTVDSSSYTTAPTLAVEYWDASAQTPAWTSTPAGVTAAVDAQGNVTVSTTATTHAGTYKIRITNGQPEMNGEVKNRAFDAVEFTVTVAKATYSGNTTFPVNGKYVSVLALSEKTEQIYSFDFVIAVLDATIVTKTVPGQMIKNITNLSNSGFFYDVASKAADTTEAVVFTVKHNDYEDFDITVNFKAVAHQHNFTYSADKNVITATCGNKDGGCGLTNNKVTLTLTAPESLVYTGSPIEIGYGKGEASAWKDAVGSDAPAITYEAKTGSALTESKAKDAGSYTAKVTVDTDKTATLDFEITKKTPTAGQGETISIPVYYGDAVADSALASKTTYGGIEGTFAWKNVTSYGDVTPDGQPAEFDATFTPKDSKNYEAVDVKVKVTVNKAFYMGNCEFPVDAQGQLQPIMVKANETSSAQFILEDATINGLEGKNFEYYLRSENGLISTQPEAGYIEGKFAFTYDIASKPGDTEGWVKYTVSSKNYQDFTIGVYFKTIAKTDVKDYLAFTSTKGVEIVGETVTATYGTEYDLQPMLNPGAPIALTDLTAVTFVGRNGTTYTESTTLPTDAGEYTAKVAVKEDNATYMGSASVDFVVNPRPATVKLVVKSPARVYTSTKTDDITFGFETEGFLAENAELKAYYEGKSFKTADVDFMNSSFEISTVEDLLKAKGDYWMGLKTDVGATVVEGAKLIAGKANYAVTITGQNPFTVARKSSGGGGGGNVSNATVTLKGSDGTETYVSVKIGEKLANVKAPEKKGFIPTGWFSDAACTKPYDENTTVTASMTLYAGYKVDPVRQIILTIGDKNAKVWNEDKVNDVAPVIRDSRTHLPGRFEAEALGATVAWDASTRTVTITGKHLVTGKDVTIVLTIGSVQTTVNGNAVALDTVPIIENSRTYLPVRFLGEQLGAEVTWDDATRQAIITVPVAE